MDAAGYGNLVSTAAERVECAPLPYWWKWEDSLRACPRLIARRLNATQHTQCLSLVGVMRNGDTLKKTAAYNISHYAHRTLPTLPGAQWEWDYSSFTPAVVVVNLGTNDYDTSVFGNAPTEEAFEAQYVAFVGAAMAHYDRAATHVLLVCGPMTNRFCGSVSAVAETLLGLGYSAAYAAASLPESPAGNKGCAGHPDVDEDIAMAKLVVPVLKKLAGWE